MVWTQWPSREKGVFWMAKYSFELSFHLGFRCLTIVIFLKYLHIIVMLMYNNTFQDFRREQLQVGSVDQNGP